MLTLPVAAVTPMVNADSSAAFAMAPKSIEGEFSLLWMLVFAFVGGLILNVMPCVLPVVSLKLMSMIRLATERKEALIKHGMAFAIGLLVAFWILAGVIITLKAYGTTLGWGFHFQQPLFVAILAMLFFVLALSLFGVFEVGTSLAALDASSHKGLIGSMASGMLAAVVSTPCTGPFLGAVFGLVFILPAWQIIMVFTAIALGMACPYVAIGMTPAALKLLPKPGSWMVAFRHVMAFMLMATVVWLVWVFGAQTDNFAVFALLCGLLAVAVGAWAYGRWGMPVNAIKTRWAARAMVLLAFIVAIWVVDMALPGKYDNMWEPFDPERVVELQREDVPVFVNFTARWCLICQANGIILESSRKKFEEYGVVMMKADWTSQDPIITRHLQMFGRNGVPLYVLYGRNTQWVLPQLLTPDIITEYLEKL